MPGKPYMQIFIGDWIKDTRLLSLEARGVLVDIRCYLWWSDITGVISTDTSELSRMLGGSYSDFSQHLDTLDRMKLLKVERPEGNRIIITDATMVAKASKSAKQSDGGKKGMEKRYRKQTTQDTSQLISIDITTAITNSNIDNDSGIDNAIGKGKEGTGEKPETPSASLPHQVAGSPTSGADDDITQNPRVVRESRLSLSDCLEMLLRSDNANCPDAREVLMRRYSQLHQNWELKVDVARRWGEAFNQYRKTELETEMILYDYARWFANWLKDKNLLQDPKTISANATNSNRTNSNATHKGGHSASSAVLQQGEGAWDGYTSGK